MKRVVVLERGWESGSKEERDTYPLRSYENPVRGTILMFTKFSTGDKMKYDTIVILGGGISKDGELSEMSKQRVKKGLELFQKGIAQNIIVSGKHGFILEKTKTTEARAMSEYLKKYNIPEENIFLEEESLDTLGNAYFTKIKILEPKNWKNIFVVTSDFHVPRASYIFKKVLGKEYNIDFLGVQSNLSYEEFNIFFIRELKSLHLLAHWLENVEDGDTNVIEEIISKHPIYREINKETKELLLVISEAYEEIKNMIDYEVKQFIKKIKKKS